MIGINLVSRSGQYLKYPVMKTPNHLLQF